MEKGRVKIDKIKPVAPPELRDVGGDIHPDQAGGNHGRPLPGRAAVLPETAFPCTQAFAGGCKKPLPAQRHIQRRKQAEHPGQIIQRRDQNHDRHAQFPVAAQFPINKFRQCKGGQQAVDITDDAQRPHTEVEHPRHRQRYAAQGAEPPQRPPPDFAPGERHGLAGQGRNADDGGNFPIHKGSGAQRDKDNHHNAGRAQKRRDQAAVEMQAFGCCVNAEHPAEQRIDKADGKQLADRFKFEHFPHSARQSFHIFLPFCTDGPIIAPAPRRDKTGPPPLQYRCFVVY